jgi:hypothetical protein
MDEGQASIRDQARAKIREAAELLARAGIKEDLEVMASKEQDLARGEFKLTEDGYDWEVFNCAVCGDDHQATFNVRKPVNSFQYALEVSHETYYYRWSFWGRIKEWLRQFRFIVINKKTEESILISKGDDLRRLKDAMSRLSPTRKPRTPPP